MAYILNILCLFLRVIAGFIGLITKLIAEGITVFAGVVGVISFLITKLGQIFIALVLFSLLGVDFITNFLNNYELIYFSCGCILLISGLLLNYLIESGHNLLFYVSDICCDFARNKNLK